MRGPTLRSLVLAAVLLGGCPAAADAAPPWANLLTLDRVEADPDKSYPLSEDNGPWMIVACSFSGDGAEQQARELVYELRKRYKLPAYTCRAEFQFGYTQGRGMDQFGEPLLMKHRVDDLQEFAVLVGNYAAVDDPEAQDALRRLKYARPQCLEVDERQQTNQSLAGWRMTQKKLQEFVGSAKKEKGPMGHAFVTTNPLLPKEFFANPGIDPLVLEMNKDVEHSLLGCPGKYTVQVATFKGSVFIEPEEIQAVENGREVKSKLAEAAEKAHLLTEALRVKGWEAYEFHDRHASIVTVGSFDSVGAPRADGKIEINPTIYAIMQTFGPQSVPGLSSGATGVRSLIGIPFDLQPIPVEVPRRSLSQEMAASRYGNSE
jgi:hypothetical protein